jgi:hypothetical protein
MRDWLFERLDLDPALTGDLLEERKRGRSVFWYWRQVLVAVWTGIFNAIRDHKLLAVRAIATGFAVEYLCLLLWWKFSYLLPPQRMLSAQGWTTQLSIVLLTQTVTGWVVARTHRAHQVPMLLLFLICDLLWYLYPSLSWAKMLLVDSLDQPRFRIYLVWFVSNVVTLTAGVLLGGLLVRPKKTADRLMQ